MAVIESTTAFGQDERLLGTITFANAPSGRAGPPLGFVFFNAGFTHRIGPHRIHVRLARRLAAIGMPSLRFDVMGLGDSERPGGVFDAEAEFQASAGQAMDELARACGVQRFVLFGLCSGTDRCIEAARRDPRVAAICLVDPFAYETPRSILRLALRKLRDPASILRWLARLPTGWRGGQGSAASANGSDGAATLIIRDKPKRSVFRGWIAECLEKGVAIRVVYTGSFLRWYNYAGQFHEAMALDPATRLVSVDWQPRANHTFTEQALQKRFVDSVVDWAARLQR